MNPENLITAGEALAEAVADIAAKRPVEAVGHALDAVFALVPDGDLAPYLTEAAERRAKLVKAAADLAKFGG